PGDTLVVAVSGGPDSVCLLHVLRELCAAYGLHLHVAHLNHQLRGAASDEDAVFVARLAAEWGIPATVSAYDVPAYQQAHGLSMEAAAREVRHVFLAGVAAATGAAGVALGHTASDQVETVVIHWLRGAGPAGLRGMLPDQTMRIPPLVPPIVGQDDTRRVSHVRLIRPLLAVTRAEVQTYCAVHHLPFRDDVSNLDETILRNRVRRQLLPVLRDYNPGLDDTIRRSATAMAEVSRFLQDQVNATWPAIVRDERPGAIAFDRPTWQSLDPVIQRGLVREAVSRLLWGAPLDLGWDHAEAVLNLAARSHVGAETHLLHDLVAVLDHDALVLGHPDALAVPPDGLCLTVDRLALHVPGCTRLPATTWSLEITCLQGPVPALDALDPPPSAYCVYLDADRAGADLALRRRRAGDRLRPLGLGGTRKLKDVLIDAHVPRRWRDGVPLLVDAADRILWVVGHQIAEDVRISPQTQRVIRLHITNEPNRPNHC
ncbi:MAG: tRNA lysidine(34) synthetase TilS, partial [Chloroflexi bacterium]|nr:tRNA lysidine(34) synthetase TilS [Chloroflexota bacterium]